MNNLHAATYYDGYLAKAAPTAHSIMIAAAHGPTWRILL